MKRINSSALWRTTIACGFVSLVFSTTPSAQQAQGTWVPAIESGCLIWDPVPQTGEMVSWSGTCVNNDGEGDGIEQWFIAGKPTERYDGTLHKGKLDGRGVYAFISGARYDGKFKDGQRDGQGTYTFANDEKYVGEFHDGKRNGHGIFTYPNGDRYEGDYRDGKRDGYGIFTSPKGTRYDGQFHEGNFNGEGKISFSNGNRYTGEFKDGEANGHGTYTFPDGDHYVGEFRDNFPNGFGTFTTKDSSVSGQWFAGCLQQGDKLFAVGRDPASCRSAPT